MKLKQRTIQNLKLKNKFSGSFASPASDDMVLGYDSYGMYVRYNNTACVPSTTQRDEKLRGYNIVSISEK